MLQAPTSTDTQAPFGDAAGLRGLGRVVFSVSGLVVGFGAVLDWPAVTEHAHAVSPFVSVADDADRVGPQRRDPVTRRWR